MAVTVTVRWQAAVGVTPDDSYQFYRSTDGGNTWGNVGNIVSPDGGVTNPPLQHQVSCTENTQNMFKLGFVKQGSAEVTDHVNIHGVDLRHHGIAAPAILGVDLP